MSTFISLAEASAMTARYRDNREDILQPVYRGNNLLPLSETFDRAAIETLLNHSGCVGLRGYYGMDEEKKLHLILVGVNENNADMLPPASVATAAAQEEEGEEEVDDEEYIVDRGIRCPPDCPPASPLNQ